MCFNKKGDLFQGGDHVIFLKVNFFGYIHRFGCIIQNALDPGLDQHLRNGRCIFSRYRHDPDLDFLFLYDLANISQIEALYPVIFLSDLAFIDIKYRHD